MAQPSSANSYQNMCGYEVYLTLYKVYLHFGELTYFADFRKSARF